MHAGLQALPANSRRRARTNVCTHLIATREFLGSLYMFTKDMLEQRKVAGFFPGHLQLYFWRVFQERGRARAPFHSQRSLGCILEVQGFPETLNLFIQAPLDNPDTSWARRA